MLKKPSEYFNKIKSNETNVVEESIQKFSENKDIVTFSESFDTFKKYLSKIESISEFSETLDNYRVNVERINYLSEKIEGINEEIQSLLKKEDLDRVLMSQLFVVEESIRDIQSKVKGINEKNLTEIRLDVSNLTNNVSEFLDVEVPKYKKLVVDAEIRTNNRYEELEKNVNNTLEGIGEFVEIKYDELTNTLTGINEQSLSGIIEDFKLLDETVLKLKEDEIPKYKGFIVETERKTEVKLDEFNQKLDESLVSINDKVQESLTSFDEQVLEKIDTVKSSIKEIDEKFEELKEDEIPKYKGFIVETERKTEVKLDEFNQKLDKTLTIFDEKLDEAVSDVLEKINSVETISSSVEREVTQKIEEVQNLQKRVNNELKNVEEKKEELSKKVTNLEVEIIRNESHIRTQNEYIENIQEEVRDVISKLHIEELEEKNYELTKKIVYLEEVFEKFNEKEILTENLVTELPPTKNDDPLTPLDQNFVTLDQLQQHYRLFINRIQQQLSTIGGGGETRLKYLDDIVGIATNSSAYDGKYLKYNHSIGKFEFVTISGGSGGGESYWVSGGTGIVTTSNVGINTTNPQYNLDVNGDINFTGTLYQNGSTFVASRWTSGTGDNIYKLNGNVGIGTTDPTSTLSVYGTVTANDFDSASDIKLKTNISIIDDPLSKIVKLNGVNFEWKKSGKKSLGVIAQQVEEVLPELVSGEINKSVNYNGIIGLLIECVKKQQEEIDHLKRIIDK